MSPDQLDTPLDLTKLIKTHYAHKRPLNYFCFVIIAVCLVLGLFNWNGQIFNTAHLMNVDIKGSGIVGKLVNATPSLVIIFVAFIVLLFNRTCIKVSIDSKKDGQKIKMSIREPRD